PGTEGQLRRGRRYSVARRLAGLLAEYHQQRPAMTAGWREGGAGDGIDDLGDDLEHQLDGDLQWQPELWRRVLDLVDAEPPDVRHDRVVRALREDGADRQHLGSNLFLPGRLSLFGHTRIARSEVEVLSALGEHLDVHLWLPQASPRAWAALAEIAASGPVPRDQDLTGTLVQHPLLGSLGRDARELQRTLALVGGVDRPMGRLLAGMGAETHPGIGTGESDSSTVSMLAMLQADIAADHPPTDAERLDRLVPATDRSIQVHACHGQMRQVAVLRDVLTDLLEADPTLEPRDILVMCPDIETYAPLVHASFGLGEIVGGSTRAHPAHGLRVRLADRAPLHTNPLVALTARLVELAGARVTADQVLDLLRSPVVRHRWGLDEDALERLTDWADATTVRWGLDAQHRAQGYALHNLAQNTWAAGVDRLLVGAAVDGEDLTHLGQVLALDDLDSGDLDLVGRLAELLDRLRDTLLALRDADTVEDWVTALDQGVQRLADVPLADAWQLTQLQRQLDGVRAAAATRGSISLTLSDVRALLHDHGGGRPTRSGFRTGSLTVCTMVPMRSVPHRVVCLLGLDDGTFPRSTTPDGDNVLARRPVTGERDPRTEDRQLFLDAVMSAGETLIVTYTGFDVHSGQERPPAVPLGELLDTVRATATGDGVDRILTRHPLQPFDPRNLGATPAGTTALLPHDLPFSHDPAAIDGALAREHATAGPVPLASQTLGPFPREDVALDDLVRFFDNPARAYLRSRLGLLLPEDPSLRADGIPVELDGLQRWQIGERMLQSVLDGALATATVEAELWRGELPPDDLGATIMDELCTQVQTMAEAVWRTTHQGGWGQPLERSSVDIDVALPGGRHLVGTVGDLIVDQPLRVTSSSLKAKHRMQAWLRALALAGSGRGAHSHVIAKYSWGRGDKGPVHLSYAPPSPQDAARILGELADLRDRGLQEVLPLPTETSWTWADQYRRVGRESSAHAKASHAGWVSDRYPKEQDDPSWLRVLGRQIPLDELAGAPMDDERWAEGVQSRLGQLALRAWGPLMDAEWMGRP
ncbi:MAG: exodeoxyribonuclease V subunit gamma, partial [Ornithinimicrobium sp.]|uniref:exodeoxyribonuclease V subunit gamma n=1 Tax=Ornithinimicrobium sp. TaxID=1977084 RepID=UPI0026DF9336